MSLPPVHFYSIHASSMTLHAYVYNRANKVCTFLYYSITLCNPFSRAMYVKIKDHHPLQLVLTSRRFSHYLVVSLNTHTHISIAHTLWCCCTQHPGCTCIVHAPTTRWSTARSRAKDHCQHAWRILETIDWCQLREIEQSGWLVDDKTNSKSFYT